MPSTDPKSRRLSGPLFKWFGSKWTASNYYPSPTHDTVIEPFAGGAGYSLRHSQHHVLLAEADPNVYALWHWLIHEATEEAIRDIPVGLPVGADIRTLGLSRGQELLLKHWQRTNNVGETWTISPWGDKPGQWTENTRARVASEHHLIKHWRVVPDGLVLMRQHQEPAFWFVDPPYQYNYKYRSWNTDYSRLAEYVHALPGSVLVCEALDPQTGAMPDWLPFEPFRETVTSRRKQTQSHHSREVMYLRLEEVEELPFHLEWGW